MTRVLGARDWQELFARARNEFPLVTGFVGAITGAGKIRSAAESIIDLLQQREYLGQARFGREDDVLAVDAGLLEQRMDVGSVIDNPSLGAAIARDFEKWQARYRRAYRREHRDTRKRDRELQRRAATADLQLAAAVKLAKIAEPGGLPDPSLPLRWQETRDLIKPCGVAEDDIPLARCPYCESCQMEIGALPGADAVEVQIGEIEKTLEVFNRALSQIAVRRALSGKREAELRTLLDLNAASDLSALSLALDVDVIKFLERFTREPDGGSG